MDAIEGPNEVALDRDDDAGEESRYASGKSDEGGSYGPCQADALWPIAAYWIAFGPHGPRALPPPDETFKVVTYTIAGVAAAVVLMFIVKQFARPPPSTMNKEWEEQTNEYLKVCFIPWLLDTDCVAHAGYDRHNDPSPFLVSRPRAILGRVRCRASPRGRSRAGYSMRRRLHIIYGVAKGVLPPDRVEVRCVWSKDEGLLIAALGAKCVTIIVFKGSFARVLKRMKTVSGCAKCSLNHIRCARSMNPYNYDAESSDIHH